MHRYRIARLAAVTAMALGAQAALPAQAADSRLTLKRVLLSTGGVGYFEYEADVDGAAALPLTVRLDQVNDVLKSIVVYDSKGGVGAIDLPGKQPLRDIFREMPFAASDLNSPATLLRKLQGAEVSVTGSRELAGRVVSVQDEQFGDKDNLQTRHRVALMTAGGLQQFILEDVQGLTFKDPALQAQLDRALKALSENSAQDRRTLTVRTTGSGSRKLRVAYVAETPLWKASYRLTVRPESASDAKQAQLQGWAVLENLTGETWQDVDLTIVSGNPVTFKQALYDPYYVSRPEIPVEVFGRVMPKVDSGATNAMIMQGAAAGAPMPAPYMAMAPAAPAPSAKAMRMRSMPGAMMDEASAAEMAPEPVPPVAQLTAAQSSEATAQVLFHMPTPVTVQAGSSVLLPIVDRSVPVDRLDLYQPQTDPQHPLASVSLKNESGDLPPGVLTLFERDAAGANVAYVGDAQLGALPKGESRLLSFAVDQGVKVSSEGTGDNVITGGKVVDGVLTLTRKTRNGATYTVTGDADEARTVTIEHPKMDGWKLVEPTGETVEETATAYRIRRSVGAGQVVKVTVTLERQSNETVALTGLEAGQLRYYASAQTLPAALRRALEQAAQLQEKVASLQEQREQAESGRQRITEEQERIRRNLGSVPANSDLQRRYLASMTDQEDRMGKLLDSMDALDKQVSAAQAELASQLRSLNL